MSFAENETVYISKDELEKLMRIAFATNRVLRISFGFGGPTRNWLKHNSGWESVELEKIRADSAKSADAT